MRRRRKCTKGARRVGSPLWGTPGEEPAKSGIFIKNMKGARRRPSISVMLALALLVERRVDLGDLLGLERVAPGAVSVPVLGEAESEDAEVRTLPVGDLLQSGEQLLLGRRPRVGLDGDVLTWSDLHATVVLQARRGGDQLAD